MVPDTDIERALQAERQAQHGRVLLGSLLGSSGMGVMLAIALWPGARPGAVLLWLAALAGALGLRWATVRAHTAAATTTPATPATEQQSRWARRHRLAFLAHGLAWVSVVLVPAQLLPGRELDLLVFALSIVTAGALTTAAFDLRTALFFSLPTVSAALLLALRSQDPGAMALAAMAAIYLCVTAATARRAQQMVREGVRLRLAEN
ncbi:hypothetical protein IP80_12100, partial [beta proteobacterium AAP65]